MGREKIKARQRRYMKKIAVASASGRGRVSEEILLNLANKIGKDLAWFQNARMATEEEDRSGIDVVVEGRGKRVYLQAKSSQGAARTFADKPRDDEIHVIVVSAIEEVTEHRLRAVLYE